MEVSRLLTLGALPLRHPRRRSPTSLRSLRLDVAEEEGKAVGQVQGRGGHLDRAHPVHERAELGGRFDQREHGHRQVPCRLRLRLLHRRSRPLHHR